MKQHGMHMPGASQRHWPLRAAALPAPPTPSKRHRVAARSLGPAGDAPQAQAQARDALRALMESATRPGLQAPFGGCVSGVVHTSASVHGERGCRALVV